MLPFSMRAPNYTIYVLFRDIVFFMCPPEIITRSLFEGHMLVSEEQSAESNVVVNRYLQLVIRYI